MKTKTLVLLAALAIVLPISVRAQEVTVTPSPTISPSPTLSPSPTPKHKFGEAVKEMRQKNNEIRKEIKENEKEEIEELEEDNEQEEEELRETTKKLMISKTPEDKKASHAAIIQERKDLKQKNKESVKALRESFQSQLDAFRISVRAQWISLWESFFERK
jgi:cell shape-determining protein MreC